MHKEIFIISTETGSPNFFHQKYHLFSISIISCRALALWNVRVAGTKNITRIMPNHTFNSCPQNRVQQSRCHVAVDNAKRFIDLLDSYGLICQIAQPKFSLWKYNKENFWVVFLQKQIRNMSQHCLPSCGWCSGGNLPFSAVDLSIEAGDCCGFAVRSLAPHNHVTMWRLKDWQRLTVCSSAANLASNLFSCHVSFWKSNTLTLWSLKTKEPSRTHYLFWPTVPTKTFNSLA